MSTLYYYKMLCALVGVFGSVNLHTIWMLVGRLII